MVVHGPSSLKVSNRSGPQSGPDLLRENVLSDLPFPNILPSLIRCLCGFTFPKCHKLQMDWFSSVLEKFVNRCMAAMYDRAVTEKVRTGHRTPATEVATDSESSCKC